MGILFALKPNDNKGGSVWGAAGFSVSVFQSLMLLEVVHAAIGLVKASPFLTLLQVGSRLMVVWFLNAGVQFIRDDAPWIPLLIVAWGITEMIRYPFYIGNILGRKVTKIKTKGG